MIFPQLLNLVIQNWYDQPGVSGLGLPWRMTECASNLPRTFIEFRILEKLTQLHEKEQTEKEQP